MGLLGWREKRGFVSLLSESPLGQPLSPGVLGYGLTMRLSFLLAIPHPEPRKRPGNRIAWLEGRETRGKDGLPIPLFGNVMDIWDVKLRNVGLGRKISCHV